MTKRIYNRNGHEYIPPTYYEDGSLKKEGYIVYKCPKCNDEGCYWCCGCEIEHYEGEV